MTVNSWDVNNPSTQDFRLGLNETELVIFLTSIPETELPNWQVARSDAPDAWMPCSSLPYFRLRPYGFGLIPPELGLSEPQISWIESQLRTPASKIAKPTPAAPPPTPLQAQQGWVERRKYPRKKIRLQVVLIQGKDAFRTFTRDISLGGLALEKAVPQKMIGSECTIFITDPSSNVKYPFEAKVMPEPPESGSTKHRLSFLEIGSVSRKALEAWLDAVVSATKKAA